MLIPWNVRMKPTCKKWAVADGREALGTVRLDDSGNFVAVDIAGRALGKFATLLEAARAFNTTTEMTRRASIKTSAPCATNSPHCARVTMAAPSRTRPMTWERVGAERVNEAAE
jgi:hypothetical protein